MIGYDEKRGLGVIELTGGRHLAFHATSVTDGSRRVEPGSRVACTIGPGHLGDWVAVSVAKIPPGR